jgi:hypothetical protein
VKNFLAVIVMCLLLAVIATLALVTPRFQALESRVTALEQKK